MLARAFWARMLFGCCLCVVCFFMCGAVEEVPVSLYGDNTLLTNFFSFSKRWLFHRPLKNIGSHFKRRGHQTKDIAWYSMPPKLGETTLKSKKDSHLKKRRTRWEKKMFIYDADDRVRIDSSLLTLFPYVNIVHLSVGCMGTLVSPSFVLTAAHCVHNGTHYSRSLEMLKVYVNTVWGIRMYNIQQVSIPAAWLLNVSPTNLARIQHDYAILQLTIPAHNRKTFAPLQVPDSTLFRRNIHFYAFNESMNSLWKSVCEDIAQLQMSILVSQCDSSTGNSGASIYEENRLTRRKRIIGIVSSTAWFSSTNGITRFTIIPIWTSEKLLGICEVLGDEGLEYNMCQYLPNYTINSGLLHLVVKKHILFMNNQVNIV